MKKGRVILTLTDDMVNKDTHGLPPHIIGYTLTALFQECLKGIDCIKDIKVEVTEEDDPKEQADDFGFNSNGNTLN